MRVQRYYAEVYNQQPDEIRGKQLSVEVEGSLSAKKKALVCGRSGNRSGSWSKQLNLVYGWCEIMIRRTLAACALVAACGGVIAGGQSQWASVVQINTGVNIFIDTDEETLFNPSGCSQTDFYAILESNQAQKRILAGAMMAQAMAGTLEARFWIGNDCSGNGTNGRPVAVSIQSRHMANP